jgi:hypothetical protein
MEYNTALCNFLKLPPDPCTQSYANVTTQIYPLRANPDKITEFCVDYLNKSPYETFEPAGPWIIMQVVDYGKISFAEQAPAQGQFAHKWFAQHELAFGIPLTCRDKTSGAFKEFGVVYPFIWVDNPLSMEGGRQIYGWPKAGMEIDTTPPELQPNRPRILVRVKVSPFLVSKGGSNNPESPFVEIYQTRPFLSGRSGIAEAVTSVPRAVSGFFSVASSALESMSNFANFVASYQILLTQRSMSDNFAAMSGDLMSLAETMQTGLGYFNSLTSMLTGTTIGRQGSSKAAATPKVIIYTMKQVRDAASTTKACYQAIVRSEMTVDQVSDGGLLFDPLSGDPSGGIEIRLLRSRRNEYLNKLLDMVAPGPTTSQSDGMLSVRPLMPFWEKANLSYGLADQQSWRTKETDWLKVSSAAASKDAVPKKQDIDYQKRGSGSALAVSGRRRAPDAVLHIFMLRANKQTLEALINDYINKLAQPNKDDREPCFDFEVKDYPTVYVTLLNYESMTIDGRGGYGDTVLAFAVLVKYWHLDENKGRIGDPEHAFIPIYTFVGTDWNFITEYEVYGRLAFKSAFEAPEDAWLKQSAPSDAHREVLSVSTTLFPKIPMEKKGSAREGQGAAPVKVITIFSKPFSVEKPKTHSFNDADAESYLTNYGLDEYLTTPNDIASSTVRTPDSIALKQVRNATHGQEADYQSLVGIKRSFTLAEKFGESSVKIRIYEHEGFPLIEKMGLQGAAAVSDRHGNPCKEFEAKSLSFTGTLEEEQGRELWRRVAPRKLWSCQEPFYRLSFLFGWSSAYTRATGTSS